MHRQLAIEQARVEQHLGAQVRRHAAEQGYTFAGPVSISLCASHDETVGRFRVHSSITTAPSNHSPNSPGRSGLPHLR